ncbi:hypothetical protein N7454_007708 [Penicillium verhagenii]|nr:hypothetical protein N7454_007708 [Penicillium verhagenii]
MAVPPAKTKEVEDRNQATGLPDYDKVSLLRFKDVLSSANEYNRFKARVETTLQSAGLLNLIDSTKNDLKTDPKAINWFKLSKMVASWLCTNMSQKIFQKCKTTSQYMLLATEIWAVLERLKVGTGVFSIIAPIRKFNKMTPDQYPAPSVYAASVLEEYGKICARWDCFHQPYAVLINILAQIDNAHITDVILQALENLENSSGSFTSTSKPEPKTTEPNTTKSSEKKEPKNKPPHGKSAETHDREQMEKKTDDNTSAHCDFRAAMLWKPEIYTFFREH